MTSRVLTAVAWPYANGPRHIGHVSGFGVPSDIFSRFMRMSGHDVLMVSGTDEHGTPILVQAEREGLSPRETADKYNRVIVKDLHGLGLSYDLFTRTTPSTTTRWSGSLPRAAPQRLRGAQDQHGCGEPVDRTDPAGPLHRRHLPDLRIPQRAR